MTVYYEKKGLTIRDAELEDIDAMKDNLREADKQEIWASDNHTPEEALRNSFSLSTDKMTILFDGQVAGMFGVVPVTLLDNRAVVWMLTTNVVEQISFRFAKLSSAFISLLKERYGTLFNFVDARHKKSIQWLKWCGATIFEPESFGAERMPFHYFVFGGQ